MPFLHRARFDWRLHRRNISLGDRTLIMGILNVTPDSFSDGGRFLDANAARDHALAMLDDGADILDLGGESTRPNATPLTSEQERERVLPVLRAILQARPDALISIDTYHAETARLAVQAGAEIVNDVSGHLWDPLMSATCAMLGCGSILMHTRGRPQEWSTLPALAPDQVVPLVLSGLKERAQAATSAGVLQDSIVLDPGFGFGKILDENFPLLANFADLQALGFPLLAGLSRKSFLRRAAAGGGLAVDAGGSMDGLLPTTSGNVAAILGGSHILRVHDVRAAREGAAIADRILGAGFPVSGES